jgi:hypothetical protein
MGLAQDDDVVEALAPDRSDQPFGKPVLPRRRWYNGFVAYAHGANSTHGDIAINAIAIPYQVARRFIPRECLGELACDPFCCWIFCDVDPDGGLYGLVK